jgi:tetratricopeptide (TPR) repeat protein
MTFQRATVFLRKRDYRQALEHFEQAYRLNDREGEHLAWIAWTRFCDPKSDRKAILPQAIRDLKKAIEISPRRPQSHFFLGELYVASGEEKRALAAFEKVIEINPNHVDALRQLRLIRMRQERADKKQTTTMKAISRFLKK